MWYDGTMETTKNTRPQVTLASWTLTAQQVNVHNTHHAWTLRASCPACRRVGTAYIKTR